MSLTSLNNSLLSGVPGRYVVSCDNGLFHQNVLIVTQRKFYATVKKLRDRYSVQASYAQSSKWHEVDPSHIAPQLCPVVCKSNLKDKLGFNGSILFEELEEEIEVFNCYCMRTYHLTRARLVARYSFLLKKGLVLIGRSPKSIPEECAMIDMRSIIYLKYTEAPNFHTAVMQYNTNSLVKISCPPLFCNFKSPGLEKYMMLSWSSGQNAVNLWYKKRLPLLEYNIKCYEFEIKLLNLDLLEPGGKFRPSNTGIVPQIQYDMWYYMEDRKRNVIPVYRCYFSKMINVAEEPGHIIFQSHYENIIKDDLHCEVNFNKRILKSTNVFDFYHESTLKFTTNAGKYYDIYGKIQTIKCDLEPKELEETEGFVYGWYDPIRNVYEPSVRVDAFEEGSHTITCNIPHSTNPGIQFTFYVVREKHAQLVFDPPPQEVYKRGDQYPGCYWNLDWMNKEKDLKPILIREGQDKSGYFEGKMICRFESSILNKKIEKPFKVIGYRPLTLKIEPSAPRTIYRYKENATLYCTTNFRVGREILDFDIFWSYDNDTKVIHGSKFEVSSLRPGKYDLSCRTNIPSESAKRTIYVIVMKRVPTVVCELVPPIKGSLPTFYVVRPYRRAVVKRNRIVPGNSGSDNENGTYICVYDANNIYLTRVFVIAEVHLSSTPVFKPTKREYISGETIACSGTRKHQSGYYMIDVINKKTGLPLLTRQQGTVKLESSSIVEVLITCTSKDSYLDYKFEEKEITLSALIRPSKNVQLMPPDKLYADRSSIFHCGYEGESKMDRQAVLSLFINPERYRDKVNGLSFFSFAEQGAVGGRYHFTCALVVDNKPLIATVTEIIYIETPEVPIIPHDVVYGNEPLYCITREYPVEGRVIKISTASENGEIIEENDGSYIFSPQSLYGYYNVTCTVRGFYHNAAFHLKSTRTILYTELLLGPEYRKEAVDILSPDILNRLCLYFAILIFVLLIALFLHLERHHRREHLASIEDQQRKKTFRSKHLRELFGQNVTIDLNDASIDEALKFMTLVSLFDASYNQVKSNFSRRGPSGRISARDRRKKILKAMKVAIYNAVRSRIIHGRKIEDTTSSESSSKKDAVN
ncbi:hypothetical protein Aperf_G00000131776 [Anoplocephala perfoliata]